MVATAKLNREYAWRLAGVGMLMVAMMLWALYDGLVAYPRQNSRYAEVRPVLVEMGLTAGELVKTADDGLSVYEQVFLERGISVPKDAFGRLKTLNEQAQARSVPEGQAESFRRQLIEETRQLLEREVRSSHDINSQFVMAGIALLAAVVAFTVLYIRSRRCFRATESGLEGFTDESLPYSVIEEVDWSRWQEKRIVVFVLADGRRFTLDGWHYGGAEEFVEMVLEQRPDLKIAERGEEVA